MLSRLTLQIHNYHEILYILCQDKRNVTFFFPLKINFKRDPVLLMTHDLMSTSHCVIHRA